MLLENLRRSRISRLIACVLIFNFILFQNAYPQDQFQVQEGTHLYTPVKEIEAERLEAGDSGEITQSPSESLPNPMDFWNESFGMFDLNLLISFCGVSATVLWR